MQTQLLQRGINYVFHLATRDDCGSHLVTLAEQATLVVTEEMPVDPPRRFLKALANQIATPVISVDTACVIPMRMLKKHYTRGFEFRSATKKLYAERLTREWPESNPAVRSFDLSTLPFQPLDLQAADLPELVSRCEIDHSVGPVVDTQGGSNAGYARWNRFLKTGLGRFGIDCGSHIGGSWFASRRLRQRQPCRWENVESSSRWSCQLRPWSSVLYSPRCPIPALCRFVVAARCRRTLAGSSIGSVSQDRATYTRQSA